MSVSQFSIADSERILTKQSLPPHRTSCHLSMANMGKYAGSTLFFSWFCCRMFVGRSRSFQQQSFAPDSNDSELPVWITPFTEPADLLSPDAFEGSESGVINRSGRYLWCLGEQSRNPSSRRKWLTSGWPDPVFCTRGYESSGGVCCGVWAGPNRPWGGWSGGVGGGAAGTRFG